MPNAYCHPNVSCLHVMSIIIMSDAALQKSFQRSKGFPNSRSWPRHIFRFIPSLVCALEACSRENNGGLTRVCLPFGTSSRQLAAVLQFAHGREYAHQDVKPENVFISAMRIMHSDKGFVQVPEVKLGDWGLAQHLPEGQRGRRVVGSCIYMAPEVVDGDYGCEIDIWSLGVTLYVALSGALPSPRPSFLLISFIHLERERERPTSDLPSAHPPSSAGYLPFWAMTNEGIFAAIQRASPDYSRHPWPSVSPQAKSLVQWMLHPDPPTRITAGGILDHPWIVSHCRPTPLRCILTSAKTPLTPPVDIPSKLLPRNRNGSKPTPPPPPPSGQLPWSDASESRVPSSSSSSLKSPRAKLTRPQYRSCEASTLTTLERKSGGDLSLSPTRPPSSSRRRFPPSPPPNPHPHPHPPGAGLGFATAPIPPPVPTRAVASLGGRGDGGGCGGPLPE